MFTQVLIALLARVTLGYNVFRINDVNGFINFMKSVNNGTNYSGTTMFLDSDLSFSGKSLEQIGLNSTCQFLGVFDGQGHLIGNLKMNFSSQYTGLFGYSTGLTIRNVVLDSSCSLTNLYNGSNNAYVGGIIGKCYADSDECNIENSVIMASITFNGNIDSNCSLYIGGIAGKLYSSDYSIYVKNCANYGSVTHLGASNNSHIGGIVGSISGPKLNHAYLQNCLNHGAITHNGKTTNATCIGGVSGSSSHTYIENCVSARKLPEQSTSSINYTGAIVGIIDSDTYINNCYCADDACGSKLWGNTTYSSTTNTSESSKSILDPSLIDNINNYTSKNDTWNRWVLNAKGVSISFVINNKKVFTVDSKVVLLPDLIGSESTTFSGWYADANLTEPSSFSQINSETTLYGVFCGLPNYTVTLDVNGDNTSFPSSHQTFVTCNNTYYGLINLTRTGYAFVGWFTEKDEGKGDRVVSGDKVKTLKDHTLYAHWENNASRKSKTLLVVGITIPVVVIVVAIVALILFFILRKRGDNDDKNSEKVPEGIELDLSREEYNRVVVTINDAESITAAGDGQGALANLYPQDYTKPTMEEALLAAGLMEEQVDYICSGCEIASQRALKEGRLFDGFTEDDAAAIAMYTYDFGSSNFEHNPYRIINRSLAGRNYNNLQKASGLLYLVMTALRKLPRYTGKTLYRGVRSGVNLDKGCYNKGSIIVWSALSSTSPSMETTKAFLARGSKSGNAVGTLFIIEEGWGYNIQPYSLFPDETEILLEPERQFKVTGMLKAEGLTIINLQMLDTPLLIPEVFGRRKRAPKKKYPTHIFR